MEGRSEGQNEAIAFIHAADAASWAVFLQNKLHSDSYKIQSYLHHEPNQNYIPELFSCSQTCVVLVSPFLLEPQHTVFWTRCVERFHQRTVILLLGSDEEELKVCLGDSVCDRIRSHHCLEVDGSKDSVSNALVKMIEVYESTDFPSLQNLHEAGDEQTENEEGEMGGIYDFPPRPRQQNSVVRVMPSTLYENDSRDVLILMEREAEGSLTMVLEGGSGPSRHVTLEHVVSSAYKAKVPDDLVGKVKFTVQSDEQSLGRSSLHICSRLDQLRHIIQKETSPLTLLCNAMGVSGYGCSQTEELDSVLAKRLTYSHLPPGLAKVLHLDDHSSTDPGSSQWPTLLHFAAEFNLTKVCEELLLYPGIIHSACTENCDGLFPCQLAEKNGFSFLQKRLLQFVENMRLRRSAADSGISFSENTPSPSPHNSQCHVYVNERPSTSELDGDFSEVFGDYVDMTGKKFLYQGGQREVLSTYQQNADESKSYQALPAPTPCLKKIDDGYAKPRSFSEGCVKIPYSKVPTEAKIDEEDSKENEPPPLKPKVGRTKSAASALLATPATRVQTTDDRPLSNCSELSDHSEAPPDTQDETSSNKSSTETLTHSESGAGEESERKSGEVKERLSWELGSVETDGRPVSQASTASSPSDSEASCVNPAAAIDEKPVLRSKRNKSVQDKISHFFKKIKSPRKFHSASESDLPAKGQKKSVVYSRQSTASTNSDPSGYLSASLRSKCADSERDSGAVCDDIDSPVLMRKRNPDSATPRNSGKRNATMQRRMSTRMQRAKDEDLGETPTIPARESRGTFVSFIK